MEPTFKTDPEFSELCPPLTPEERNLLMASIERDGCREPLIIWNGLLLDGHNRREICEELQLKFQTREVSLPDRAAAIDWIVMNQLGRRNLPEEQKAHLRGLRYRNEKKREGGNGANQHTKQLAQSGQVAIATADRLAKELGVSATTVRRDADFSAAVDAIGANLGKEAKAEILSGRSGVPRSHIVEIANQPAEKQAEAFEDAKQGQPIVKPPSRRQSQPTDSPSDDDKCWSILAELHDLTKSASLVVPYSKIKRLLNQLRDEYRRQHRASLKD